MCYVFMYINEYFIMFWYIAILINSEIRYTRQFFWQLWEKIYDWFLELDKKVRIVLSFLDVEDKFML